MLAESDLRAALKLLQISCFTPYTIAKNRHTSKRSFLLVLYNLTFVVFLMYNVIYTENDVRNNVDFENKSFLISIALDVADIFENVHPCFICLRAIMFTKAGIDIWFKINNINRKFKQINVEFDHEKLKNYMYAKSSCFIIVSSVCLAADIILCGKLQVFYTPNYWILCGLPLIQNSVTVASFTGLLLILYQRFWAINELMNRVINDNREAWTDATCERVNYENLRGKYLLMHYLNQSVNMKKKQPRVETTPEEKPPFYAMLKNYENFGRNFYSEPNLPRLIRILKSLHFDLFQVAQDVNSIFGWNLLFAFTGAFIGTTINMYYVIIYHLTNFQIEEYISCFIWMSICLCKAIYLMAYITITSNEAQRIVELLHFLANKVDFNESQLHSEIVMMHCLTILVLSFIMAKVTITTFYGSF